MKIYIIGSGVSGLIAASNLAKNDHDVTLIEKNDVVGGRLFEFNIKGYRFNNGPSWYWMKDVFEQVFGEIGIKNMYKLRKLDPQYEIVFSDKTIKVPGNYEDMKKLFNGDKKLDEFVERSKNKYELSRKIFLNYWNLSITEYFNKDTLNNLFSFYKLHKIL